MIGKELKAAFAGRKRGHCAFCGRVSRDRTFCTRANCKRTYQRLWHRDNRPRVTLRKIVKRLPSPTHPNNVIEVLECGHIQRIAERRHAEAERRRCLTCKPEK